MSNPDSRFIPDHSLLPESLLILDAHNDLPWQYRRRHNRDVESLDLRDTTQLPYPLKTDLTRLRRGRVGAQFWAVYVPPAMEKNEAVTASFEQIDVIYRMIARYPETFEFAASADDIERVRQAGRIASLIGIEGGHSMGESLAVLRMMHRLGARYMTLTHSKSVGWADSATDAPQANGLTPFGVEVVREMNRLGMMIDLSHVTSETMRAVLDVTEAPVLFTHSNAFTVCAHNRNVPDDVLDRVRDNNGVVCVTFMPPYITNEAARHEAARKAMEQTLRARHADEPERIRVELRKWDAENPLPRVTMAHMADHMDYIRARIGSRHLGIGGDFEGFGTTAEGLEDVACYPGLLSELARRGYPEDEIRGIAGGNVLRVMRACETASRRLSAESSAR